jgi:dTDP-4-dehydrorhamnose reductase
VPATLIVGSDSLLGRELMARMQQAGESVIGTTRRRDQVSGPHVYLDLSEDVERWQCDRPVGVAVLCAGATKLASCEADPAATARINVQGISALARNLAVSGTFILHLSTSSVFDGSAPRRLPHDPVSPRSEYGRQKAEAERQVLELGKLGAVVRLTKVLEPRPPLLQGWVQALRSGQPIHPFSNMVMAPIPLEFVGEVLHRLVGLRLPGVIQVSAERDVTYAEAARHIARRLGADEDLVQPITAEEAGIPRIAKPAHTTLDAAWLRGELGLAPPDVWSTIDTALGL